MKILIGVAAAAAFSVMATEVRAQIVAPVPRFSVAVGATPGADGGGSGGVATLGACLSSCGDRLSFWAIGAFSFRQNGTTQFAGSNGLPVVDFRSERNISAGVIGEYGVWGGSTGSRVSVVLGALASRSRVGVQRSIFVPGGVDNVTLPMRWRNDYGPLVGLQLERPAFGTRLLFSVRAEDTDRWRVPVSIGLRF